MSDDFIDQLVDQNADIYDELYDLLSNEEYNTVHDANPSQLNNEPQFIFFLTMTVASMVCLVLVSIFCSGLFRVLFVFKAMVLMAFNIMQTVLLRSSSFSPTNHPSKGSSTVESTVELPVSAIIYVFSGCLLNINGMLTLLLIHQIYTCACKMDQVTASVWKMLQKVSAVLVFYLLAGGLGVSMNLLFDSNSVSAMTFHIVGTPVSAFILAMETLAIIYFTFRIILSLLETSGFRKRNGNASNAKLHRLIAIVSFTCFLYIVRFSITIFHLIMMGFYFDYITNGDLVACFDGEAQKATEVLGSDLGFSECASPVFFKGANISTYVLLSINFCEFFIALFQKLNSSN